MTKSLCALLTVALLLPTGGAFGAVTTPEVTVPQFVPPALSTEAPKVILGYSKGTELIKNSNYNDMTKNTFLREVTKMSAMGAIRKYGATTYRPGASITGYEAVTMLVNARGREAAVQRRVNAASNGLNAAALKTLYNTEYAREALTLAIVPQAEQADLQKTITREKLIVWAARAGNLQPDYNDLTGLYSFKDASLVTPTYQNLIEAMVGEKYIYLSNDGKLRPKATMTRGEFSNMLEHMSDKFMTNLGMTSEFGLIIGKKAQTETTTGAKIQKTVFTIKSIDGKLNEIVTQYNPKTKVNNQVVSYKNGVVSDSRQLMIGDEISYLVKNNQVYYVEALNDDTIIDKMKEAAENGEGIVAHFGNVGQIISQSRYENGKIINSNRIRLKDFDGNVYDVNVETNPKTGIRNDIIVYKNGNGGGSSLLKEGDSVEYYVKDGKTMVYMKVLPVTSKDVTGTLRALGKDATLKTDTVSIYDYNDKIVEYPVAQHALVTINGNYATLKDLQHGQDLKMIIKNGYVSKIETETFTENPAAITEYGKMRMGAVYYVYTDSVLFELNNGQRAQYMVSPSTQIIRDGIMTSIRSIKEGDQVKLYFNDIYSNQVDRIEIEGAERLIKQVYKGKIEEVNSVAGTMTISDPYVLRNAGWVASSEYMVDIPYTEKTLIYNNSNVVRPKDFGKYYKDKTAYVVVEENYGSETAVKVTVQNGGELLTYDSVDKLDTTLASMELYNKENYKFNAGTIVIKDGRLIDPGRIKRFDSAYVIGDYYNGNKTANVVKLVTRAESIFDNLYVGALYKVNQSDMTFKNYTKMSNNQWGTVETNESRRFIYTTDTGITNSTVTPSVSIKPADFFHKGFSEEENKDKNNQGLKFERYYGLFVTDGKDVMYAINLRQKGLFKDQNIDDSTTDEAAIKGYINDTLKATSLVRGTVESIDTKWTRVQLTNSNEWSSTLSTWNVNAVDTYVKYDNTLILKNNKIIKPEDIKQGDSLYVLRNKETALVIFVESK
jgi:hypothetical protein